MKRIQIRGSVSKLQGSTAANKCLFQELLQDDSVILYENTSELDQGNNEIHKFNKR